MICRLLLLYIRTPGERRRIGRRSRELAAHLSFINRIHISYLNQSYERNYYWNMRLRCEQLFLRLSGSTVFGREVRELREIYRELAREQEAASAQTADRERLSEGPGQGEADRRGPFRKKRGNAPGRRNRD